MEAAERLREWVTSMYQESSSEIFDKLIVELSRSISHMLCSNDEAEQRGGAVVVSALLYTPFNRGDNLTMRLVHTLRSAIDHDQVEDATIFAVADVVEKVAHTGSVPATTFIQMAVSDAVQWTSELSTTDSKRLAGVLIGRALADSAPTFFYQEVREFLRNLWPLLCHTKVEIRQSAAKALRSSLRLLRERKSTERSEVYTEMYRNAREALTGNTSGRKGSAPVLHGALLTLGELLDKTDRVLDATFIEAAELVLKYKDSRDPLVRTAVILLIPRLAAFAPRPFAARHATDALEHLMDCVRPSSKDQPLAFIALGNLACVLRTQRNFSAHLRSKLPALVDLIREGLTPRSKSSFCPEALHAVSMLARTVGAPLAAYMHLIIDPMFAAGLTPYLVQALTEISFFLPAILPLVQERLLNEASHILARQPFFPPTPDPMVVMPNPLLRTDDPSVAWALQDGAWVEATAESLRTPAPPDPAGIRPEPRHDGNASAGSAAREVQRAGFVAGTGVSGRARSWDVSGLDAGDRAAMQSLRAGATAPTGWTQSLLMGTPLGRRDGAAAGGPSDEAGVGGGGGAGDEGRSSKDSVGGTLGGRSGAGDVGLGAARGPHPSRVVIGADPLGPEALCRLALRTLASFDFSGVPLLEFTREVVVGYLDDPSPGVRRSAARCCIALLLRPTEDEEGLYAESRRQALTHGLDFYGNLGPPPDEVMDSVLSGLPLGWGWSWTGDDGVSLANDPGTTWAPEAPDVMDAVSEELHSRQGGSHEDDHQHGGGVGLGPGMEGVSSARPLLRLDPTRFPPLPYNLGGGDSGPLRRVGPFESSMGRITVPPRARGQQYGGGVWSDIVAEARPGNHSVPVLVTGGGQGTLVLTGDILHRLLMAAVADMDPRLRAWILRNLSPHFDVMLSQSDFLASLAIAVQDEDATVRSEAIRLLGRLARRNPSQALPPLRTTMLNLLGEMEFASSPHTRREGTALLGKLIRSARRLVRPFVPAILSSLLPKLEDENGEVVTRAMVAIGDVAEVGAHSLRLHLPDLLPILVATLVQHGKPRVQYVAVQTLGQLVEHTGEVVRPYLDFPRLLSTLLTILGHGQAVPWKLREAVLQTIGLLGALDPSRYHTALLALSSRRRDAAAGTQAALLSAATTAQAGMGTMPLGAYGARIGVPDGMGRVGEGANEAADWWSKGGEGGVDTGAAGGGRTTNTAGGAGGNQFQFPMQGGQARPMDPRVAMHQQYALWLQSSAAAAGPTMAGFRQGLQLVRSQTRRQSETDNAGTGAGWWTVLLQRGPSPQQSMGGSAAAGTSVVPVLPGMEDTGDDGWAHEEAAEAEQLAWAGGGPVVAPGWAVGGAEAEAGTGAEGGSAAGRPPDPLRGLTPSMIRPSMLQSDKDFYPSVTIMALMRILQDTNQSKNHSHALAAITWVFRSLGSRCASFLPQVVPPVLDILGSTATSISLKEQLLHRLSGLVKETKHHIRDYLVDFFALIRHLWVDPHTRSSGVQQSPSLMAAMAIGAGRGGAHTGGIPRMPGEGILRGGGDPGSMGADRRAQSDGGTAVGAGGAGAGVGAGGAGFPHGGMPGGTPGSTVPPELGLYFAAQQFSGMGRLGRGGGTGGGGVSAGATLGGGGASELWSRAGLLGALSWDLSTTTQLAQAASSPLLGPLLKLVEELAAALQEDTKHFLAILVPPMLAVLRYVVLPIGSVPEGDPTVAASSGSAAAAAAAQGAAAGRAGGTGASAGHAGGSSRRGGGGPAGGGADGPSLEMRRERRARGAGHVLVAIRTLGPLLQDHMNLILPALAAVMESPEPGTSARVQAALSVAHLCRVVRVTPFASGLVHPIVRILMDEPAPPGSFLSQWMQFGRARETSLRGEGGSGWDLADTGVEGMGTQRSDEDTDDFRNAQSREEEEEAMALSGIVSGRRAQARGNRSRAAAAAVPSTYRAVDAPGSGMSGSQGAAMDFLEAGGLSAAQMRLRKHNLERDEDERAAGPSFVGLGARLYPAPAVVKHACLDVMCFVLCQMRGEFLVFVPLVRTAMIRGRRGVGGDAFVPSASQSAGLSRETGGASAGAGGGAGSIGGDGRASHGADPSFGEGGSRSTAGGGGGSSSGGGGGVSSPFDVGIQHPLFEELISRLLDGSPLPPDPVDAGAGPGLAPFGHALLRRTLGVHPFEVRREVRRSRWRGPDATENAAGGVANRDLGPDGMARVDCNVANLRRAWDVRHCVTSDDWVAWMQNLCTTMLRESPSNALRSTMHLSEMDEDLLRELFNAAFVSCWCVLAEDDRESLVQSLKIAFSAKDVPAEILQQLLNLAEFMEYDDKALPIEIPLLGMLAERCQSYAKALHYREMQWKQSPASCVERLISINNQVGQPEAAVGILKLAQQLQMDASSSSPLAAYGSPRGREDPSPPDVRARTAARASASSGRPVDGGSGPRSHAFDSRGEPIEVKESWYEKLGRWDEALDAYERKLMENDTDLNLVVGKMRCLQNLGEWHSLAATAREFWPWIVRNVHIRADAAPLATRAAWALGNWGEMEEYAAFTSKRKLQGSFYRAVLAVHHDDLHRARTCIEDARMQLADQLGVLASESYARAYWHMVTAQQLSELEEVVVYRRLLMQAYGAQAAAAAESETFGLCTPQRHGTQWLGLTDGTSYAQAASEALERLAHLRDMWNRRLEGCQKDVDAWHRVLSVRALVPYDRRDMRAWIKFSGLCRKSGRMNLALSILLGLGMDGKGGMGHTIEAYLRGEGNIYQVASDVLRAVGVAGGSATTSAEGTSRGRGTTPLSSRPYVPAPSWMASDHDSTPEAMMESGELLPPMPPAKEDTEAAIARMRQAFWQRVEEAMGSDGTGGGEDATEVEEHKEGNGGTSPVRIGVGVGVGGESKETTQALPDWAQYSDTSPGKAANGLSTIAFAPAGNMFARHPTRGWSRDWTAGRDRHAPEKVPPHPRVIYAYAKYLWEAGMREAAVRRLAQLTMALDMFALDRHAAQRGEVLESTLRYREDAKAVRLAELRLQRRWRRWKEQRSRTGPPPPPPPPAGGAAAAEGLSSSAMAQSSTLSTVAEEGDEEEDAGGTRAQTGRGGGMRQTGNRRRVSWMAGESGPLLHRPDWRKVEEELADTGDASDDDPDDVDAVERELGPIPSPPPVSSILYPYGDDETLPEEEENDLRVKCHLRLGEWRRELVEPEVSSVLDLAGATRAAAGVGVGGVPFSYAEERNDVDATVVWESPRNAGNTAGAPGGKSRRRSSGATRAGAKGRRGSHGPRRLSFGRRGPPSSITGPSHQRPADAAVEDVLEVAHGVSDLMRPVLRDFAVAKECGPMHYSVWHAWAIVNFEAAQRLSAELQRQRAHARTLPVVVEIDEGADSDAEASSSASERGPFDEDDPEQRKARAAMSQRTFLERLKPLEHSISLHVQAAVVGFATSIDLGRSRLKAHVLQDLLRLVTLWMDHGEDPRAYRALFHAVDRAGVLTWLQVIPQLIARIHLHTTKPKTVELLNRLLGHIGREHPQALVYPLTVASKSTDQKRLEAAEGLLQKMRRHWPRLVWEASRVSGELIRVAILWQEEWYSALESASRLYYNDRDVPGMMSVLRPLHEKMARGAETLLQRSFLETFGEQINKAWSFLRRFEQQGAAADITNAWGVYYQMYQQLGQEQEKLHSFYLQDASPGLAAVQDLELAIPGTYAAAASAAAASMAIQASAKAELTVSFGPTGSGSGRASASEMGGSAAGSSVTVLQHVMRGDDNGAFAAALAANDAMQDSQHVGASDGTSASAGGGGAGSSHGGSSWVRHVVRIARFDPFVRVIVSKQRPRKLVMIGSDERRYPFLLKGHEDLRQDERVMQLFGLVNTLLQNDPDTSKQDLSIRRYAVTPLSHNAGVVGWVPNCDTLHSLIRDYRDMKKIHLDVERRLIAQMAPMFDSLTLLQKVEVLEYALDNTTGQDLYQILWRRSRNSENWLERRTNYTRSLAVMSMVGYILGLGDRHPSNLMLDRKSGKILHIDFGDCFEVAMTREKFPERVPFRLTRMMVNAMEVCGIEGNFRSTAETVMRVLRQHRDSVMAMLEAFVHDPLINWRLLAQNDAPSGEEASDRRVDASSRAARGEEANGARRIQEARADAVASSMGMTMEAGSTSVYGNRGEREREMREKLGPEGTEAPAEALNERAVAVIARVQAKLTGRDFSAEEELSVPAQVQRLVVQATSHENLAQAYIGWCPFW